ncbi:MAG: MtrB/PioB family decaheme-associated outer membrane protein, partial [Nitrosospira sp.]|nr:MtrB/PioB family decaheme-associated outer membrane protein [Nitrosospira sp.]
MVCLKIPGRRFLPIEAAVVTLLISPGSAGLAWADTASDRVTRLTRPHSTVDLGVGYLFNDGARFGQYSGMRDAGPYGLINADILKRSDATGTWYRLRGRNLGLDSRELRLEHSQQGNWGYVIDFSQTPRYEPFTVRTAVSGIGTSHLHVPTTPTAGDPMLFKTERTAVGFGLGKSFAGNMDFQLHFRNEEKDGARVFGRGTRSIFAGAFGFTPEPINSTTRLFGATLGYNGKRLQLSGGYYGTMYVNHNTALHITGGSSAGGGSALNTYNPIALPPDNQSHQLFLGGGYSFTPTTRGNFKVAYTHATQTNAFIHSLLLAPGVGSHLGGRIDTTLLQGGLTARPLPKLSLLANIRYEDRDDKTPILNYNPHAPGYPGFNQPFSMRTLNAKVEAYYALPMSFRLTGGVDFDQRHRDYGAPIVVRHRGRTDEWSYRVELRRSMSETVTGAVSYIYSDRSGSDFLRSIIPGYPGFVSPINLADRSRHKVRLLINWVPIEPLSLQFIVDESRDNYGRDNTANLGPQEGMARDYAVDA